MRKLLGTLFALLLCAALIPALAGAETNGTCGDSLTWVLNDNGTLTISGTGEMADYTGSNSPFYNNDNIKSLNIGQGVTSIGNCAFSTCQNLASVTIPKGVTRIGDNAFQRCSSLWKVTIPNSMLSIGRFAFSGCGSLKTVTIQKGVTNISEGAFNQCYSLESITLPEGVTSISGGMFAQCIKLTSVTIPDSVTSIGDTAFSGCSSLANVTIPAGVTSIGASAFSGTAITSVKLPSTVASVGEKAFDSTQPLASVIIPSSVKSIGANAFCRSTQDTLVFYSKSSGYEPSTNNGGSGSAKHFSVPGDIDLGTLKECGQCGDSAYYYIVGDYALYVTGTGAIRDSAFSNKGYGDDPVTQLCTNLKSVVISEGITHVGEWCFFDDDKITSVTLPESLESTGKEAFSSIDDLVSIKLPQHDFQVGDHMFYAAYALESVELPQGLTTIPDSMFSNCTKLVDITIPSTVKSIGELAFNGTKLSSSLTLHEGLTKIGSSAFYGAQNLQSVSLPASLTSLSPRAFDHCTNLKQIVFGGAIPDDTLTAEPFTGVVADVYVPHSTNVWPDNTANSLTVHYYCTQAPDHMTDFMPANLEPVAPTCTELGKSEGSVCPYCYAVFTAQEVIPASGHTWSDWSVIWNDDYTAYAQRSCTVEGCDAHETAEVTVNHTTTKAATCEAEGEETYTAALTIEGDIVAADNAAKTKVLPALGHDWGQPAYLWNKDTAGAWTVTASRTCARDGLCSGENGAAITQTDDGIMTSEVTKTATCSAAGSQIWTATFSKEGFAAQTDEETIPIDPNAHAYGEPVYEWTQDGEGRWQVSATAICENNAGHVASDNGTVTAEVSKKPTYTDMGETTYTAMFENSLFATQSKVVADIPALEKEPEVETAEDAINALGDSVGADDKAAVEAAREAYEQLTAEQKQMLGDELRNKLEKAEQQIQAATPIATPTAIAAPTEAPTEVPSETPTVKPTEAPTAKPTEALTAEPTEVPTEEPTAAPTAKPTEAPTAKPTEAPTEAPTAKPTEAPTSAPEKISIATCTITVKKQTYTGKAIKPAVSVVDGDVTLVENTDYTVAYKNNKKVGTATVTVTGAGRYTGSAKAAFKIVKASIANCAFTVKDQTYSGKAKKPAVTVKLGTVKLKQGTDYTVAYKNNKKIGLATVTVKGKGNLKGSKKVTFRINPKATAFTKLTGGKQQITLKWKNPKNITGYQIEYSLKKDFTGSKKVTVKKAKTLTTTIRKLKANKKYYVRIRTYATVGKKNYYSAWSKAKTVKTKGTSANGEPEEEDVGTPEEDIEATLELDAPSFDIDEAFDEAAVTDPEIELQADLP